MAEEQNINYLDTDHGTRIAWAGWSAPENIQASVTIIFFPGHALTWMDQKPLPQPNGQKKMITA